MLKKDCIFYDFKVTYVIDQKPPEESESSRFFVVFIINVGIYRSLST